MAKTPTTLAAIDLGTFRCCAVIAEITGPDTIDVIGIGTRRTDGIRKGVIVNLEALVSSIRGAKEAAEEMAGRQIESLLATVPAAQARSFSSSGVVTIGGRDRLVTREDLRKVEQTVRAVQIPDGQSILHVMAQEYELDGQQGIQDPVGMTGSRLKGSFHVVTVPQKTAQHVVAAINAADVEVTTLVHPLLGSAEAVLTREEKEQGVFLIDCGAGTTDIALYERGALWFTASIPAGGDYITSDISIGLHTQISEAEQLKRQYARATAGPDDDVVLEFPTSSGGPPRLVARSMLTQIVSHRTFEILELVRQVMDKLQITGRARAGAVLVGGTSNLEGIVEVAEEVLGMPVRAGVPRGVGGLVEETSPPSFASPVGLLLWEMRHGRRERAKENSQNAGLWTGFSRSVKRARQWFTEMF